MRNIFLRGWQRTGCQDVAEGLYGLLIESGWRGSRFERSLRRAAGEFEPQSRVRSMFRYNQTKYPWPLVAERSAQSTHKYRRAGNGVRECTPPECLHSTNSITSPARTSTEAGTSRPSALAVFRSQARIWSAPA